jgi:hypothetical protein
MVQLGKRRGVAKFVDVAMTVSYKLELSIKSSKESTEPVSLLKTRNKVVEVG